METTWCPSNKHIHLLGLPCGVLSTQVKGFSIELEWQPLSSRMKISEKVNNSANQAVIWEPKNSNIGVKFSPISSLSRFARNRSFSIFVCFPKERTKIQWQWLCLCLPSLEVEVQYFFQKLACSLPRVSGPKDCGWQSEGCAFLSCLFSIVISTFCKKDGKQAGVVQTLEMAQGGKNSYRLETFGLKSLQNQSYLEM